MERLFICFALLVLNIVAVFAQDARMTSVATSTDVDPAQLLAKPVAANWLSYNGDYTGRRYSALREINTSNVAQLRAQWVFHAQSSSSLEVTPVAVDGIQFVTAANDALDRKSTRLNSSHMSISYAVFCLKKKNFLISSLIMFQTIISRHISNFFSAKLFLSSATPIYSTQLLQTPKPTS